MTRWRAAHGLWLALVAPAWSVAACGETNRHDEHPSTAGQPAGGATAGQPPNGRAGGGTGATPPIDGAGGGGGNGPALPPGLSDVPIVVECGADMCASVAVGPVFVEPCCAAEGCGLETEFLALVGAAFAESCQPRNQPGNLDRACPTSSASSIPFDTGGQTIMVPISGFAGCCREGGTCGVVVDDVRSPLLGNLATVGLGCVDAAPFFPGAAPAACGPASGGSGGSGGSGDGGGGGGELGGAGAGGLGGAG
jgi:hypothetical protein